jgi:hypothetical protein
MLQCTSNIKQDAAMKDKSEKQKWENAHDSIRVHKKTGYINNMIQTISIRIFQILKNRDPLYQPK